MRNGAEPLMQGCFGLMVCLVAEAIRWNSPLQVDPEPSGRIQFEVLRSPAVSSAAPNPLGRGIASPLLARAPRTNGTRQRDSGSGCRMRRAVSCVMEPSQPHQSGEVQCLDAAQRPALC